MDIDLGISKLTLGGDDPILPAMLVAMGVEDKAEALAVGPTMAKPQAHSFRRTLSVTFSARPETEPPQKSAERIAKEVATKSRGAITKQDTIEVNGMAGTSVEIAHKGPAGMPLRTLAVVLVKDQWLKTFALTTLKAKSTDKAVRAQFDTIIQSVKTGSFIPG